MELSIEVRSVLSWVQKGGLAVLDQALFSGANFLVNILLARWLAPKEYGAFAVALSIFYLLAGFHTAVLTEPMMVFGAGKYRKQFRKYLGMLLYGHWALSALISLGLAGAAWFFLRRGSPLGEALLGLAVAAPFLLLLWLTRRVPYVERQPQWAVVGSGVNCLVSLGGLFVLWWLNLLSNMSSFALLGVAGCAASFVLVLKTKPQALRFAGNPTPSMILADHRDYGIWNVLAAMLYWLSSQMLIIPISIFLSLEAAGAVRAVNNLFRPLNALFQSLSLIILPMASLNFNVSGKTTFRKLILGFLFFEMSVAVIYSAPLVIFAQPVLHLLYGGKYDNHTLLVFLFACSYILSTVIQSSTLGIKSTGRTKDVLFVWIAAALSMASLSLPFIIIAGLNGALLTILVSYSIAAVVSLVHLREIAHHESPTNPNRNG